MLVIGVLPDPDCDREVHAEHQDGADSRCERTHAPSCKEALLRRDGTVRLQSSCQQEKVVIVVCFVVDQLVGRRLRVRYIRFAFDCRVLVLLGIRGCGPIAILSACTTRCHTKWTRTLGTFLPCVHIRSDLLDLAAACTCCLSAVRPSRVAPEAKGLRKHGECGILLGADTASLHLDSQLIGDVPRLELAFGYHCWWRELHMHVAL